MDGRATGSEREARSPGAAIGWAVRGAVTALALAVAVAAAQDRIEGWPLAAAILALALGSLAAAGRERRQPVGGDDRPAALPVRGVADALLASIPDPVILVDRRAVVLEANAAARALLPGLRTRHPLSFALRSPVVLDGIEEVGRTGAALSVEYAERIPTERAFEVLISPLDAETPDLAQPGVMLFFRDQTSARRLESMRVDFVANASHELRTPLASLLGFIETLEGPARNDAPARERFLAIMRGQAQRMTRLVDDLLSLSRIEMRAHVSPQGVVDLAGLVAQMVETLRPLAREQGVQIEASLPPDPALVQGDRDELLRLAENLIENGIKYGAGGGRVVVTLAREPGGQGARMVFSVRDFGPGIGAEHLPRLTERFYRVDVAESRGKGGTGLGLAIVKHIVNRHRGQLAIESTPGEGALFKVTLVEALAQAR